MEWTYKRHVAHSNYIVAQRSGEYDKTFKSFEEIYGKLIGTIKEDTRSAADIIKETYKKFGVEA